MNITISNTIGSPALDSSGSTPIFEESLDFSDDRNSQYIALF